MEKYRGVDYLDLERLLSDDEKLVRDSARDIITQPREVVDREKHWWNMQAASIESLGAEARIDEGIRKRYSLEGGSLMRSPAILVVLLLAAAVGSGARRSECAETTRIRIGYPSPSASFSPLFAAKDAGLFEKYGLAAELLYLQGIQITQVHVSVT
jgi:hypothetical protein